MSLPPDTTPAPTATAVFRPAVSPAANPPEATASKDSPELDGSAFEIPKLRLEIRDLRHAGASAFLASVNAADCLEAAARNVLALLYLAPDCASTTVPPTRSVTVIVRDMPGVAYTTGSELDGDHKEIHFAAGHIERSGPRDPGRRAAEIAGVLTHEMVHCLQYNGRGSCPSGLIEGVADWVRLRCGLCPPHWRKDAEGRWDAGYQHTGYFLDYLEDRFGDGTVRRLNEKLRGQRYEEKAFWTELLGRPVEQLWRDYGEHLQDQEAVLVSMEDAKGTSQRM